jgi:hypothetical protein
MPDVTYHIELDGKAPTREQLDQFDEIAVERATDMAWEARLKVRSSPTRTASGPASESFLKALPLAPRGQVGAGGGHR